MDNAAAILLPMMLVSSLSGLVVYAATGLGLSKVFEKLGEPAWKGWVPIYNLVTVMRLGGVSPLWVIALFIPVVSIAGAVFFYVAVHAINRRFGKGIGFTVLAIFLLPVWACLLGFDRAAVATTPALQSEPAPEATEAPEVAPTGGFVSAPVSANFAAGTPPIPPAPFVVSAPSSLTPPPPPPVFGSAPDSAATTPPPSTSIPAAGSPSGTPAPTRIGPPPLIGAPPGFPPSAPAIPAATPAAPAPAAAAPAVPVPAAPATPAPVVPVPSVDVPAPAEAPAATVVTAATPVVTTWLLETNDGQLVTLDREVVLLGRNPTADPGHPEAQLVALDDSGKTVSKTHARLELIDGTWRLTDLNSTNGVLLVSDDGEQTDLAAGATAAVGERFLLGELPTRLYRQR
ncbi:DUF5684 domain-containing protein [Glaciihabitans sp. dw_435]|uniref:DUF5684 domain-containing protein n=1 Tax=Glaciihabitans sp. dw_435 TaxID=2720081 RepID=UPI001BD5D129|nr:DUF5684 domain-containing protein [Glaciihabitans sp. dw_435]